MIAPQAVNAGEAEAAIAEADVPVLLMVLVHLTGDTRWLEPPFQPARDTYFFADESGGLAPELQAEVRQAALEAVLDYHQGRLPAPTAIDDALYLRMMRVCVAEAVPAEYLPMMLEEMGLRRREAAPASPAPTTRSDFRVLIIGAGMSGLCAAMKLREAGIDFTVIEKNAGVGGTWFENIYPEAGCDVPNHFYSYSFRPNPDWSAYFSKAEEIREYLERCAGEAGILEHIRLRTRVLQARYDDSSQAWQVTLEDADGNQRTETANAVICAVGQLNRPKVPAIEGADSFRGPAFHTARWPEDLDIRGKRVAVIGTGASAMQLARTTAEEAERLLIFQRSAQWAIPTRDYHRSVSAGKRWLLNEVPFYGAWYRFTLVWRFSDHLLATVYRDPDWPWPQRAVNEHNDRHRQRLTEYIIEELGERQDLLEKVLPDYPPYAKRILVDNHWFRTLTRENVELITERIERITPTGIVTGDGREHEVDVITYATGFDANRLIPGIDIRGRDGLSLDSVWGADDSRAYLGITVPGFPNLFCLYGPNTNSGHGGSIVLIAECQVRYVLGCLQRMREADIAALEVREDVYTRWNAYIDGLHEKLIWTHPGMDTWYRNRHGRVVSIMPFRLVDYWQFTREPNLEDFRQARPQAAD